MNAKIAVEASSAGLPKLIEFVDMYSAAPCAAESTVPLLRLFDRLQSEGVTKVEASIENKRWRVKFLMESVEVAEGNGRTFPSAVTVAVAKHCLWLLHQCPTTVS